MRKIRIKVGFALLIKIKNKQQRNSPKYHIKEIVTVFEKTKPIAKKNVIGIKGLFEIFSIIIFSKLVN